MKNFTKLLLLICVVFLSSQISKAQSIVAVYTCTGAGSATLSVSPTTGITAYSWRNSANAVVATTPTINQLSGTFRVIITRTSGNTTLGPFTIASNIVPTTPSVTPATVANAVCGTATQTLTSSTAANYAWLRNGVAISGANASTLSISGNSVTAPSTNNYAVSVLNPTTACSAISNQVSLRISPKPATPVINPVSPNPLCGSAQTTLTATGGGTVYTWRRGATVLGSTINTYTATGTETAAGNYNYTVSYVNSVGCLSDDSAPVALTLSSKPATPVISPATLTTPICGTATQVLTVASGASSYSWKRNGAGITGSTNSITVTGNDVVTPGTYAYSVSSLNAIGCTSDESAVVSLKVSPKPATPTITPALFTPNVVCGTDTKILTATSGGSKYNWLRNGTPVTSSTTSNALTVAGTDIASGGTYSYTVSLENSVGCISDVSTTPVVLQLFPTVPARPTIANSGGLIFCEGGSVTLRSSYTANTNTWSRTVGSDTTTSTTAGIIVRTSNTLTVQAKDANGCTSLPSLPIVVTVNIKPTPPVIDLSGARGICDSDSIVLTSNNKGSGNYLWSNGRTTRSITAKTAGTYTLIYTDTQTPACTSLPSVATVLTINPLPVRPTITGPNNSLPLTEFCYRQFTTLVAATTTTGATFEWDYQNRTGSQIDVAGSAKLTTVETIRVSAKSVSVFANNPKACKSRETSDVVTITVNPLPTTPDITANRAFTFCPDSTITLTSTVSPTGAYKWINAKDNSEFSTNRTVLIDTTSKFFNNASIEKVGRFFVRTVSDKNCVSDTSRNVTITVRNAPQPASIAADPRSATVCLGGKVTLSALVSNANIARYSWRDESNQQELSTQPEVSVITSGNYSVRVRDVFGCFAAYSRPIKVSINSLPNKPTLSLTKPKVFCEEDSVVVQASLASTTPNGNRTLYSWIVDGQTVLETFSRNFSYKKVGIISVALTDSNGCKATAVSDTIRTTVNPLPNSPTITVRGANPFCADKNVALNAVGTNGVTYKWSTGATTQTITTNTAGNITVQSINGFGCLSKPSQPVLIRVNPLPTAPRLTANGDVTFCEGSRVRIVSSSAFKAYWFRSTTDSIGLGDDNTSIFASKTGSYFAKVQDDNGCISLASAPIAVDSRPNPTPTIIKQIGSFTLDAQGLGDENGYLWRYNGDLQRDLTTKLIKAKKDGDYQVQASITYSGITNIAGGRLVCFSKVSDVIKYVQDVSFEGVSVFPNPSIDGVINVEAIEDLIGANITIYDLYGRMVADYTIDKFNTLKRIELPKLQGTTYILKISSGGLEKTRKVLIF
ncbi:MAG: T9SS type A sorting domain-containing protein [Arcicella sp.]|nr:T9SS type A sorting domain-containing protein [Arcicella sp.]